MPGPAPKPTALKIIQGNPGKRKLNPNEPKPEIVMPDAPSHISEMARAHWEEIVVHLHAAKLMTILDVDALAMYCEAFVRWIEANDNIRKFGMVVKAPSGYPVQSPYLAISNKAFDQMKSILTEFGMTPSSRTRVQVAKEEGGGDFDDV